jgi:uncharacterized protein YjbI with pentapeptide repeats
MGSNLSSADLSQAKLSSADLSQANLMGSNLSSAALSWANLMGSNLLSADLSQANLMGSNLSQADLSSANLSSANLSGTTGVFDAAAWVAANLQRTRGGVLAYKTFGGPFPAPSRWAVEPGAEITEVVNPLPTLTCACGVNVATLEWCCANNRDNLPIWRLLVKWEWLAGGVIPYNTDGKFRVPRAKLLEIVDALGYELGE